MRKIREILRLLWVLRLGVRETARACSSSHSTVLEYQRRAASAELCWKQVEAMDSGILERHLFPVESERPVRPLPDWVEIYQELKRPGVTLQLLWEEYKEAEPEGYQYSRFCDLYRSWRGKLNLSMRQEHKAGSSMVVSVWPVTCAASSEAGARRFLSTCPGSIGTTRSGRRSVW